MCFKPTDFTLRSYLTNASASKLEQHWLAKLDGSTHNQWVSEAKLVKTMESYNSVIWLLWYGLEVTFGSGAALRCYGEWVQGAMTLRRWPAGEDSFVQGELHLQLQRNFRFDFRFERQLSLHTVQYFKSLRRITNWTFIFTHINELDLKGRFAI